MQMVDIGDAAGLVNPVLDDVNNAIVPLRASSNPAKWIAEATAMNKMARTRANCKEGQEEEEDGDVDAHELSMDLPLLLLLQFDDVTFCNVRIVLYDEVVVVVVVIIVVADIFGYAKRNWLIYGTRVLYGKSIN
jgi:hypothetical protein